MTRKNRFTVFSVGLLTLAIGMTAWWLGEGQRSSTRPPRPEPFITTAQAFAGAARNPKPPAPPPAAPAGIHLLPEAAEISLQLNSKDTTPKEDLEIIELLLTIFRKANNGLNPEGGLNDEIVRALAGRNAKGFAVLPPDHPALAKNGELLDRWGAPYFFHPVTSRQIDLRSAGPDHALWTADDVVFEEGDGVD